MLTPLKVSSILVFIFFNMDFLVTRSTMSQPQVSMANVQQDVEEWSVICVAENAAYPCVPRAIKLRNWWQVLGAEDL